MIQKPTTIITSMGRTGTTFFAKFFNKKFENIMALHEPSTIHYQRRDVQEIAEGAIKKIKHFGLINLGPKKLIGKWGIVHISNQRIAKNITKEKAAEQIIKQRKKFIEKFEQNLYIESNYQYYGLLDIIPLTFENYKIIYIIRDPRDWVISYINLKGWYHKTDIHSLLRTRISPKKIKDEKYQHLWKKMNQFEKLCWAWATVNKYILQTAKDNPNIKIYNFEDLFESNNKKENMLNLINFATSHNNSIIKKPENLENLIQNKIKTKINQPSSYQFPKWPKWTQEQAKKLNKICGPIMEKFGYGQEPEWKQKIQ